MFIVSPSRVIVVINTLIKIRYSFENLCTSVSSTVDEKKKKTKARGKLTFIARIIKTTDNKQGRNNVHSNMLIENIRVVQFRYRR